MSEFWSGYWIIIVTPLWTSLSLYIFVHLLSFIPTQSTGSCKLIYASQKLHFHFAYNFLFSFRKRMWDLFLPLAQDCLSECTFSMMSYRELKVCWLSWFSHWGSYGLSRSSVCASLFLSFHAHLCVVHSVNVHTKFFHLILTWFNELHCKKNTFSFWSYRSSEAV